MSDPTPPRRIAHRRPHWKLPAGVPSGLWDYSQSDSVAEDYDAYFSGNKLFDFDQAVVIERIRQAGEPGQLVADLGCGTGRALLPLIREGFRGLAVDLSTRMLAVTRRKALAEGLAVDCLQANLAQLDCLREASVDHAICLFSTLGMIRGRSYRRQALRHTARILKPGGVFVIHVHNYWYNLYDPGGPWWLLGNLLRSTFSRSLEAGDKFFHYRGIPSMFLHVFRRSELTADLKAAGLIPAEWILLAPQRSEPLPNPWWFGSLRANGWIVVCRNVPRS